MGGGVRGSGRVGGVVLHLGRLHEVLHGNVYEGQHWEGIVHTNPGEVGLRVDVCGEDSVRR